MDEEAECPICQEYLTDPVSVDCGHSFCRACITKVCDHTWSKHGPLECPLCKARFRGSNIRTNWQLRSIVEKIKAGGMRMPPIPAGKHITGRDLQGKDSACSGSDTREELDSSPGASPSARTRPRTRTRRTPRQSSPVTPPDIRHKRRHISPSLPPVSSLNVETPGPPEDAEVKALRARLQRYTLDHVEEVQRSTADLEKCLMEEMRAVRVERQKVVAYAQYVSAELCRMQLYHRALSRWHSELKEVLEYAVVNGVVDPSKVVGPQACEVPQGLLPFPQLPGDRSSGSRE